MFMIGSIIGLLFALSITLHYLDPSIPDIYGWTKSPYFVPTLIAWIIKLIVLRVGGTKVYENYTVPLTAGFVVGYFIMAMMGAIIGAIKFAVGA